MDSQEQVYLKFYNYNFLDFPEYQEGLKQVFEAFIFQHNENLQPGQAEVTDIDQLENSVKQQLVLQAQVYFFCEKTGDILSLDDYFDWKRKYEKVREKSLPEIVKEDQDQSSADPPYSSNYERVVDLIIHGKPVPGIKEIPDKLNESPESEHKLQPRKKPWESNEEQEQEESQKGSILDELDQSKPQVTL